MKRLNLWMLAAILSCVFFTISCSEIDNPVPDPGLSKSIDEFWDLPGNAGDPEVVAALQSIKNVEDLKPFMNVKLGQCYYFNYNQMVDHNDPSKGTFKQQVVLTFVGKDAPTLLHTQGYSLTNEANPNDIQNRLDSIDAPHFLWALSKDNGKDKKFDLNCVQVEYRYNGFSLPEGDKDSFKYMTAEQQSKDLHAIVTDLKKALITGDGKWLSTGLSKNGDTTTQYAYFDEQNGWNDIDVYVPFASPNILQEYDIRIGTYMITKSSKDVQPLLEKAYKKLVDDQAVADATIEAYAKKGGKFKKDSALLTTVAAVLNNLFQVQSYSDYNTWTKLIPKEGDKPETYAKFFMLDPTSPEVKYKGANARGPLHKRRTPYEVQNAMEQGGAGKTMDLQVNVRKNLETTTKKLIFVYGEDDPWTGAAIADPTNPNVKKYIVPHGTHTDDFKKFARYPGGQEIVDKIMADVKDILFSNNEEK